MGTDNLPSFSKWRNRLWPIHSFELKKIIPLFLMKFLISLNYGILNSLKDTIIITTKGSGAEVIPVLKGWLVLPIAIVSTLIYAKLSNHFQRSTIFYGIMIFFMAFIFIYGFVLFPYQDILSPTKSADWLLAKIGSQHQHWIALYRNWMHSLFFVFAELWGSIVLLLLFWGFANQISHFNEARRFYVLFSAGGNLAALCTGLLVWHYSSALAHLQFSYTLQLLITYALIFGMLIMVLHWWIIKFVLSDKRFYNPQLIQKNEKAKTKLKLLEGLKYIFASKYLRYIAVIVIAYGLTMNFVEVSWKALLKIKYPNPASYQSFYGTVTSITGAIAFLVALFLGSNIMRFFSWKFSALIPPIIVCVIGVFFLVLTLTQESLAQILLISPLAFLIPIGAIHNILSKTVKYSFFDPTKEMAFIPLDQESKVKGKAAIDIVGSRLGKSGAAWLQVIFIEFVGSGSVLSITGILIPLVAVAFVYWIFSVNYLGKEIEGKKTQNIQSV